MTGTSRKRAKPSRPADPEIITVEEATERYAKQRILMEITEFDDHRRPIGGWVVAHDKRRKPVLDILGQLLARPKDPDVPRPQYYYFAGYPRITDPSEALRRLYELAGMRPDGNQPAR
jgi:hypothetical protein